MDVVLASHIFKIKCNLVGDGVCGEEEELPATRRAGGVLPVPGVPWVSSGLRGDPASCPALFLFRREPANVVAKGGGIVSTRGHHAALSRCHHEAGRPAFESF